jgi:hypothetical protein
MSLCPYTTNEITNSFLVLMLQQRKNEMTLHEDGRVCYHSATKHVRHNTKNEVAVTLNFTGRKLHLL